jgi:hypothetical protein
VKQQPISPCDDFIILHTLLIKRTVYKTLSVHRKYHYRITTSRACIYFQYIDASAAGLLELKIFHGARNLTISLSLSLLCVGPFYVHTGFNCTNKITAPRACICALCVCISCQFLKCNCCKRKRVVRPHIGLSPQ